MAMTKTEAAKLTQDMMLRGVIETIIIEAPILQRLPFTTVVGSAIAYNRELTLPSALFWDPGDTWTEATPTFTPVTAALKIMGRDADVDKFLQTTYANPNDLEAEVIQAGAKAVAHLFSDTFINGDDSVDTKSFDGIELAIPNARRIHTDGAGTAGAPLSLTLMDELIDMIKPGSPDILLMSKRSRRHLSNLRRTSGNLLEVDRNDFGLRALYYDGIEIVIDENIPDDETVGSDTDCSTIYALKLGKAGVEGIENGEIQIDPVGTLETKDATRNRIKWYAAIALYSELGTAKLKGITPPA